MEGKVIKLFTDGEVKTKDERKFTRLIGGFGDDKPMFSLWQVGELLNLRTAKVLEDFERNEGNFEKEIDFIDLKSAVPQKDSEKIIDITGFLKGIGYSQNKLNATKRWLAFSLSGMMKLVKIATTKESWNIYDSFLEDYFKTKAENIVMKKTLLEELEELKKDKAMYLGMSIVEQDETKKLEWLNKNENVSNRIKEIELSLKEEEIIKKLKPQIDIADALTNANGYYDIGTFSKIIKVKDLGRNNLFKWMRNKEILMHNNQPYQRYIDYFKVLPVENKFTHRTDYKTMIRPKGIKYIVDKLIKDDKIITKSIEDIIKELEPEKIA